MRKSLVFVAAFLGCLSLGAAFAEDPSPVVSDAEMQDLIKLIDDTQATLMSRVTGLTDEQWNFKPNPNRWSVGECVEHIAMSERFILQNVQQVIGGPVDAEWATKSAGKLAIVKQAVPARGPQGQGGVQAPEPLQPVNKWNRQKGIEQFYSAHGEIRAYVETMNREIKNRGMQHPVPALGWLNGHDWLNMILYHTVRHTKQLIEVQEDPNYPKAAAATGGR